MRSLSGWDLATAPDIIVTKVFGVRVPIPCPRLPKRWSRAKRKRARARWGMSPAHWRVEHPSRIFRLPGQPNVTYCTPPAYTKLFDAMRKP